MYLCIGQIKDDHLKTMNQAENAIEEDFDDYAYDSNYDLYDSLDCEDVRDMTDRPSRFVQRHILPDRKSVV